ncbi:MAG: radical SAM protein [Anaerolineales bacterium]|nr:radical SAM protein [Anaerolineales bacterium]
MKIFNRLADQFSKVAPLPEGTHHVQAVLEDEKPYRLHLRLRKDGSGTLVVNASTILHLNPTAAEYAFHFIKGTSPEDAAKEISKRYRISKGAALEDYQDFVGHIRALIETPDLDPVSFLGFERVAPHSTDLTAPVRLDCALTYKLPAGTKADYAPTKRVERELSTEEWGQILDIAWREGVPHVTFTGGEPTLREDLPDLIAHAEKNGQVCGLLSDGLKLADKSYLLVLLNTGLDHLLFLLQPDNKASWKALETIMPEDLFTTVHITINKKTLEKMDETLQKLADLEVTSLSLGLADTSVRDRLDDVLDKAANLGMRLAFDLPVPYSADNPVAFETAEDKVPSGAGKSWLYVEPDGDVLPAQGMADQVLGNLLRDPWDKIYQA